MKSISSIDTACKQVFTGVTRDRIVHRRMDGVFALDVAERHVDRLGRLPTILEAWKEKAPGASHKWVVCWLPATHKAYDAMADAFVEGEMVKVLTEGADFVFRPTAFPDAILVFNPKSRCAYRVTRTLDRAGNLADAQYTCQCRRWRDAGTCKHVLTAIAREGFPTTN